MKTIRNALRLVLLAIGLISCSRVWADPVPTLRKWTVDGVVRQALIYAPAEATTTATPVVFAFHGIGGGWLITETKEFEGLLLYLDKNRETVWTAPFGEVTEYIKEKR